MTMNWAAATALISPSLGRDLAGGVRTATVGLLAPSRYYDSRTTRLDLRMAEVGRIAGLSEAGARTRVHRALKRLRPELEIQEELR